MAKPDAVKLKARDMRIYGDFKYSEIERALDVTRYTLYRWRDAGEMNDGVPWEETREMVQREMRLAKQAQFVEEYDERMTETITRAKAHMTAAVSKLMEQIEEANLRNASYKQLVDLYDFIIRMENRDVYRLVFDLMNDFIRQAGKAVAEHVKDERAVRLIGIELKEVLTEYRKELEPIINMRKKGDLM